MTQIRPLQPEDFPSWLPLWDGNNLGRRDEILTTETWSRLTGPDYPVYGLAAWENGEMTGLLHYVVHPTTGNIKPVCYMQDLFVTEEHRRRGIAKTLVKTLEKEAKKEGWARIYWLAEGKNEAVQNFYKNIGTKLDFTLHILPVGN